MRQTLGVSERLACRTLGQHQFAQRKMPIGLPDEERLTEDIIELTREFGRYGYRLITGMPISTSWRCLETSMATSKVGAIEWWVAITSRQPFFPTCYGAEFIAKKVRSWIGAATAIPSART